MRVYLQSVGSMRSNMHARADMQTVTHGPNSGKCACVNVELDEHPAGSTRYNTRARIDLQFVCN